MSEYKCGACSKIIIQDFEEWLKNNDKKPLYIQCPYCFHLERNPVVWEAKDGK